MMSLWDALRMNMMISYQELVRTFPNKIQKLELHRYTLARSTTEIFSLLFLCKTSSVVLLLIFWSSRTLTYLFSCGKFDVKK